MAALYIWKVPLGKDVISALHRLGPQYRVGFGFFQNFLMIIASNFVQSQFKFEAEVDTPLTAKEQKVNH